VLALAALERLLAWSRSGLTRDLLIVGVLLGLSVCFKQNYGVFAIVGASAGYLAIKFEDAGTLAGARRGAVREMGVVAAGVVLAGLPFLLYLLANGAMPAAWQSLVVHPFEFGGKHDIAYVALSDVWKSDLWKTGVEKLTYLSYASLRGGSRFLIDAFQIGKRLHALAYWLPLLLLGAGALLSLTGAGREGRRIDGRLFATVSTCGMIFLGVLPRADFNHLVNVYQPILVLAPIVVYASLRTLSGRPAGMRAGVLALVGVVGFMYGAVAIHYYTVLLRTHRTPISSPRAGVLLPRFEADSIDSQLEIIRRSSHPGDAVLTLPDLSMLNFLADRRVPSAYYNLYEHHIAMDEGAGVVEASELNGVQLAVTRYDNFFSDRRGLLDYAPKLANYLFTHYRRVLIGARDEFIVWRRRPMPVDLQVSESALADCSVEGRASELRKHLFFTSLYHKPLKRKNPDEPMLTMCRVDVPAAGAVLEFELGYRQPYRASNNSSLEATVWIEPDGGDGAERTSIMTESLRVVARHGAVAQPPYRRIRLDLSAWAGQNVTLAFETRFWGRIRVHPLDFKGFALVWRDAKVRFEPGDQGS
jgi:hypothetical protein